MANLESVPPLNTSHISTPHPRWLSVVAVSLAKQKFPHLVGSKWTAQQKTMGWRHFRVVNRKNQGKWVFAELVATCDPDVRFWLNAKALKNRQIWAAGWQTRSEIKGDRQTDPPEKPNAQ